MRNSRNKNSRHNRNIHYIETMKKLLIFDMNFYRNYRVGIIKHIKFVKTGIEHYDNGVAIDNGFMIDNDIARQHLYNGVIIDENNLKVANKKIKLLLKKFKKWRIDIQ